MMRFHQTPRPLLQLVTTILLAPRLTYAFPAELGAVSFNDLFARDCAGTPCGSENQYCCAHGSACVTQANVALCTANSGGQVTQAAGGDGSWKYYTTTYVETDLVTRTSIWSSYMGGGGAVATAGSVPCNYALHEVACGSICCTSQQYCYKDGQCADASNGGSSAFYSSTPGATAGPPVRPTSSGQTTVTRSVSPTTTVPFMTPVATGANVTVTGMEQTGGGGGLSGGAIAGIVIGVLAGLLLLGLICFYCCLKGLLDGCLACFGLGGRKNRRRTEIEEYERHSRHSHHGSHYAGGGGGRTWYGAARPPARVDRHSRRESNSNKNLLGVGAGLAALWAVLGLKRKRDNRRRNDEKSEYSYSSDYYTSASE